MTIKTNDRNKNGELPTNIPATNDKYSLKKSPAIVNYSLQQQ